MGGVWKPELYFCFVCVYVSTHICMFVTMCEVDVRSHPWRLFHFASLRKSNQDKVMQLVLLFSWLPVFTFKTGTTFLLHTYLTFMWVLRSELQFSYLKSKHFNHEAISPRLLSQILKETLFCCPESYCGSWNDNVMIRSQLYIWRLGP